MALDDLLISTGVDQLIRLVKERGKIEMGAASRELKQPMRTIEDWAHVLEEERLVKIEYKLTKIYLVWQAPSTQYVAQKSEKLEAKATQARQEIEQLLTKVEKGGAELSEMQVELSRLDAASTITPGDAERLKDELTGLGEKYSTTLKSASEKLDKLKKKLSAIEPQVQKKSGETAGEMELEKELATLRKFEQTLQNQLDENETFFGAFETRLEDFRKRLEEGKSDEKIEELKADLGQAKSLRDEVMGALEAVLEEQKAISQRIAMAEGKLAALSDREDSISGAKKKLLEIRKIEEDAKRQRRAVTAQLSDALSIVKKQMSKIKDMTGKQAETDKHMQQIKDDYVDVAEEIGRANDEIAERQKSVSAKLSQQMRALEAAGKGNGGISKDEVQKVSFLLRELKREQALLEENVRVLLRETELLKLEAASAGEIAPRSAAPGEEKEISVAFVEKVKLSKDEEDEFERKRDELRSLIRKMWEENKGGS